MQDIRKEQKFLRYSIMQMPQGKRHSEVNILYESTVLKCKMERKR
jgi:hypothetical protein